MASGNMGALVVELQGNIARIEKDMKEMSRVVGDSMKQIDRVAATTSRNISDIGKAGGGIRRIEGAREAANDIEKVGHASVGAKREILVLAHEISQGNFKRAAGSLMVLGERLDIMGKIMSPVGFAVGGAALALALFAAAAIKGAAESAAFGRSLLITGNYAGQTEQSYNEMSRQVAAAAHVTIGNAREMTQALISTGRFGPEALGMVAISAARLADVTGQKGEEVVKSFEKMTDGVLKWAIENNRQYHFVDGALYDHIKTLEDQGKKEEAEYIASKALYDHLGGEAVRNLGYLERAWNAVKGAISGAKDALLSIGRTETAAEQAVAIQARIEAGRAALAENPNAKGPAADSMRKGLEDNLRQLADLERRQMRESDNALLASQKTAHNDKVVEAKQYWEHLLETTRTGKETLDKELERAKREGELAGASPAEIAAVQERIRKRFEHGGSGAALNRADLEGQIKPLQDGIQAEDRLLAYRETVLEKYYKANLISEQGYYETRATVIKANQARIKDLYDREIAFVDAAAAHASDAAKKKELTNRADQLRYDEQQALLKQNEALDALTLQQTQDTDKYRAAVEKLNAELGKHTGNAGANAGAEFDRTHSDLKEKATVRGDTSTLADLAQARNAAIAQAQINDLKVQAQAINESLALSIERVNNDEQTGQINIIDGMRKESELRMQAAAQLQQIAQQTQQIAANSGMPSLVTDAQKFQLEADKTAQSANVMANSINNTFANGFATILDNTINKTKSLKQSFLDFANSLEQSLNRLISQDLFNQLFKVGDSGGGGGGGGGGIGQLIGMAIGLMSGGSGDSSGIGLGTGNGSTPADLISGYRASGGPTIAGGMYEVNERGPELLSYANRTFLMMGDRPGNVTPLSASNQGGGGNTYHMNIAVPAGTTRQTAQQQAREIMTQAQIAQARNG